MTEGYPTATVDGREVPYDPSTLRRIQEHPCFSEKAAHAFGRSASAGGAQVQHPVQLLPP